MKGMAATQGPKVRVNAVLPGILLTDWVSFVNIAAGRVLTRPQGQKYPPEAIKAMEERAYLKRVVSLDQLSRDYGD